jgi:2-(1,2-epoxy-1,2-dihydrophenyl)acetyl-CoA isomerase
MTDDVSSELAEVIQGRIAYLTLNRPKSLNALSDHLFALLINAYSRLEQDGAISVIVLKAAGRAFCAGGDVAEMPADSKTLTVEERVSDLRRRADIVRLISESSKVTIASVNGVAAGAGLSLALACDFRLAAKSAKFMTAFIKMGLSSDCGCIHLLSNLIGMAKAKELCFLSEPVTAEQAAAISMITHCVDDDALEKETIAFAERIAAGPSVAQRYMKENFRKVREPLPLALLDEANFLVRSATSEDHAEAKRAFGAKRNPVFRGR